MVSWQGSLSGRIVQTVATEADESPLELPPLGDAIHTESLDRIVEHSESITIKFDYAGYTVTVDDDEISVDVISDSTKQPNSADIPSDD